MSPAARTNEDHFTALRREWTAEALRDGREDDFSRLVDEWRGVEWRTGGKTLMAALGLQFDEVALCRGLAWLLEPDGSHGLGQRPLDAFLHDLDLPVAEDAPVEIRVEEVRADTRADIVLRVGGQTVIVEAKVLAGEQPRQADRLYKHWAGENVTPVFLTRTGYFPYTAKESDGLWVARAWSDVAAMMRTVTDGADPSAGAREFIETIGAL